MSEKSLPDSVCGVLLARLNAARTELTPVDEALAQNCTARIRLKEQRDALLAEIGEIVAYMRAQGDERGEQWERDAALAPASRATSSSRTRSRLQRIHTLCREPPHARSWSTIRLYTEQIIQDLEGGRLLLEDAAEVSARSRLGRPSEEAA